MREDTDFNDAAVEEFRQNLQQLYRDIKSWLTDFVYKENLIEIYEEYALPYKVPEIYMYRNNEFLCKIKPVGAHIIAADGRADMVGKRNKLSLVFFKELSVNKDDDRGTDRHALYEGYERAGWYVSWGKRKISLLCGEIFLKATEEVSGYKHL